LGSSGHPGHYGSPVDSSSCPPSTPRETSFGRNSIAQFADFFTSFVPPDPPPHKSSHHFFSFLFCKDDFRSPFSPPKLLTIFGALQPFSPGQKHPKALFFSFPSAFSALAFGNDRDVLFEISSFPKAVHLGFPGPFRRLSGLFSLFFGIILPTSPGLSRFSLISPGLSTPICRIRGVGGDFDSFTLLGSHKESLSC